MKNFIFEIPGLSLTLRELTKGFWRDSGRPRVKMSFLLIFDLCWISQIRVKNDLPRILDREEGDGLGVNEGSFFGLKGGHF